MKQLSGSQSDLSEIIKDLKGSKIIVRFKTSWGDDILGAYYQEKPQGWAGISLNASLQNNHVDAIKQIRELLEQRAVAFAAEQPFPIEFFKMANPAKQAELGLKESPEQVKQLDQ